MINWPAMRGFVLAITLMNTTACATDSSAKSGSCSAPKMTEQQLIQVIVAEFRRRGSSFQPNPENSRFEFAERDCDHLVRITFLPERPGSFEAYRIDRSGEMIEYVPGH